MIAGAVVLDLTRDDAANDRAALGVLPLVPDGARVTVDIGTRRYVSQTLAGLLHEQDARLNITVSGTSPTAVLDFVIAARSGCVT